MERITAHTDSPQKVLLTLALYLYELNPRIISPTTAINIFELAGNAFNVTGNMQRLVRITPNNILKNNLIDILVPDFQQHIY